MQLTAPQRTLVLWGACIPTRLYIALRAREKNDVLCVAKNDVLCVAAALIATNWLSGGVKRVGFFGGRAWCSEERRLHGAL